MNRSEFIKSLATVIVAPSVVSEVGVNELASNVWELPEPQFELIPELQKIITRTELEKIYYEGMPEYLKIFNSQKWKL